VQEVPADFGFVVAARSKEQETRKQSSENRTKVPRSEGETRIEDGSTPHRAAFPPVTGALPQTISPPLNGFFVNGFCPRLFVSWKDFVRATTQFGDETNHDDNDNVGS
jgi:hypothetical protein